MSARGMQQNNIAETLIGAIVVAVAVVFLVFAYMRTGSGSLSGYEINARWPRWTGWASAPMCGCRASRSASVSDLTLDPKNYLVTVHMNIRDDIKLPTDSSLLVTSAGFAGQPVSVHHARRRRQDDGRRAAISRTPGLDRPDEPGRPLRHRRQHLQPAAAAQAASRSRSGAGP